MRGSPKKTRQVMRATPPAAQAMPQRSPRLTAARNRRSVDTLDLAEVYGAMDLVESRTSQPGGNVFKQALANLKPVVEVDGNLTAWR